MRPRDLYMFFAVFCTESPGCSTQSFPRDANSSSPSNIEKINTFSTKTLETLRQEIISQRRQTGGANLRRKVDAQMHCFSIISFVEILVLSSLDHWSAGVEFSRVQAFGVARRTCILFHVQTWLARSSRTSDSPANAAIALDLAGARRDGCRYRRWPSGQLSAATAERAALEDGELTTTATGNLRIQKSLH